MDYMLEQALQELNFLIEELSKTYGLHAAK